jgi:hypothetical protein
MRWAADAANPRQRPLVGHWTVEGYAEESLAGPAGPVRSQETFEWLDRGYFVDA